jgi:hypothetical protein
VLLVCEFEGHGESGSVAVARREGRVLEMRRGPTFKGSSPD